MLYVDSSCTGCGHCVEVCPVGAIRIDEDAAVIDQNLCDECGACIEACKEGAIQEVSTPEVALVPAHAVEITRPPAPRRTAAASLVVSLAPVAMDLLSRLVDRWVSPKWNRDRNVDLSSKGRHSGPSFLRSGNRGAGLGPRRGRRIRRKGKRL